MKNKGITLISLVITIIILIILAGITIQSITSENGLFDKVKEARRINDEVTNKERMQLEVLGSLGDNEKLNLEILKNNINKNIKEAKIIGDDFPITVIIGEKAYKIYENGSIIQENDIKINTTIRNTRYLLIEISGIFTGSDGAVLNELEIYDSIEKIDYTILKDIEYDCVTNGKSAYWEDMQYWNYTNLNDGLHEYTENWPSGGQNCTVFIYRGSTDAWARFVIDLGTQIDIGQIKIAVGGYDELSSTRSRTPKKVEIYKIDNFINGTGENTTYSKNVIIKNNEGIKLIAKKEFDTVLTTATEFSLLNN